MSWELPKGWIWSTIGEVCHNPQYGWTTKASKIGSLQLVRTTDITSGTINWDAVPFCEKEPEDKEKYLLKDGDIIISRAGSVGYSLLIKSPQHSVFASYLIRFMPLIDRSFVAYFLKSPYYWNSISESKIGIAVPNVNATKLKQVSIPIAPLNEQHRIVAKIEELFTKLGAGVDALKKVQSQLKRYRQSVLKAAVEGRLTAEWREQHLPAPNNVRQAGKNGLEPADKLLERIQNERKAKLGKKYKEPISVDTSDLPKLPREWVWTNLNQIKQYSLYGPRYSSSDYSDDGYLVLRTSDISESGKVNISSTPKLNLSKEEYLKYSVKKGDLIITRSGSIGTLAVFNDNIESIPGAYLIQYRICAPMITSWYLFYFLKSPNGQNRLRSGSAGVGRPNLNAPTIEAIPIPFSSLQEQEIIVLEIERLFSIIDESESIIESELKRAQSLRQSILMRAFEGKLVPQDPNDEPASVLLEKIKAEKTKPKKSKQMEMS